MARGGRGTGGDGRGAGAPMPRIDWHEIEVRAQAFANEWAGETYERGESQSFWTAFLEVFGIHRRRSGAMFEYAIRKLSGKTGFIDLFWPGRLVVEQKSAGRDLRKAGDQAFDYLDALPDHEQPRFVIACDFATFEVLDRDTGGFSSFTLAQLPAKVQVFRPLLGETSRPPAEENPVNRDAAEEMATLHNELEKSGYTGHDLELMLVRLVFCLFADDALIFERGAFQRYLTERTDADGSDLGPRLSRIFQVLNTPDDRRQTSLDPELRALPYINGGLFAEPLHDMPDFTAATRRQLIRAARLDWSTVSPAIFGSMFQGVMDPSERRSLGAHYTSEKNILRVIQPLFLDALYAEFARVRDSPSRVRAFHARLATINVLDPACGCGNFLVITYRELRRLEHKVAKLLFAGQRVVDIGTMLRVNVDQLHGIEIEEFPALIAQTALWLTDHQLNREASNDLGATYTRIPLTASANIHHANALTTDWREVIQPERLSYILGNPPFVGKQYQSATQKAELAAVFHNKPGFGAVDFVAAWYGKASEMMLANPAIRASLVSTNSITQGEQVGILWRDLTDRGVVIDFAHRTFRWSNEGRDVAAVYCVVIGFSLSSRTQSRQCWIYEYPDIRGEPVPIAAKMINPYLVDAPTAFLTPRRTPLCSSLPMRYGSKPVDHGYYMFTDDERAAFLSREPEAADLFRPIIGSWELINGISRWCLWLRDADPTRLRRLPLVMERIEHVRAFRQASAKASTREAAATPTLFTELRQPDGEYLAIPEVSSENRTYLPIAFVTADTIANNKVYTIARPNLVHFCVLSSNMHMAWVRAVCGRLKSDYQYSAGIVYNNFPWPDITDAQRQRLSALARGILDARTRYPDSTLADLYDPLTMPADLLHAHQAVDRAVDRLYRNAAFAGDADRVAFLFARYAALTA